MKNQIYKPTSLARWLVNQHLIKSNFSPLPKLLAPSTATQAVDVQNTFIKIKSQQCGPIIGWKIALSTPSMQKMVGLDSPVAGRLHSRQVIKAPARTSIKEYGRLLIEFEIAVQISKNLPTATTRHTALTVASSVSAFAPAFELADDRNADYSQLGGQGLQMIADNAWNEGAILGEWIPISKIWNQNNHITNRDDSLGALRGEAFINNISVGNGFGRDLMGHPLNAIAWLANEANDRGTLLKSGDIAILGSLVTSKFPGPGDTLRFELTGFNPITLKVD